MCWLLYSISSWSKVCTNLVPLLLILNVFTVGFHLSGKVTQPVSLAFAKQIFNVSISFDRGKITSCPCTCCESATWCEHTVAVCLFRIYNPNEVVLRAPVSESLSRLKRDQLQKFAQYLISELPQQVGFPG